VLDLDFRLGPLNVVGYLQGDAAVYGQRPPGPLEGDFRRGAVGGDHADARNLEDGVLLRRGRAGIEGTLGQDFAYRVQFELAPSAARGNSAVAEAWLSYTRFKPFVVQMGAFPQPANMEDSTSGDSTLFLERATAAALSRSPGAGDGRLGITFRRVDKRWMAALSFTGPVVDDPLPASPRAAVVARANGTVSIHGTDVHIGASGAYVLVPATRSSASGVLPGLPVRFLSPPEVTVDPTPLVDTGEIQADHTGLVGLEFAAQHKNLFVQAEAFGFDVERHGAEGPGSPRFFGYYVEGSWILTGERRRWDQARGAYWFPKVAHPLGRGGFGALEVALRYSRMDLDYKAGSAGQAPPPGGIRGGDQRIWSAALAWYPTRRTRLMLEYLHVSVDRLNPASLTDPEPFGPRPTHRRSVCRSARPPTSSQPGSVGPSSGPRGRPPRRRRRHRRAAGR
jgi:phosphate-selective porin OprO/OprP